MYNISIEFSPGEKVEVTQGLHKGTIGYINEVRVNSRDVVYDVALFPIEGYSFLAQLSNDYLSSKYKE